MNFLDLEKRVAKLEKSQPLRNSTRFKFEDRLSAEWLDEIANATWGLKEQAQAAGDYRTALACVTSLYPGVQLRVKLRGELNERGPADVLDANVDADRGTEIAEMYLRRHKQTKKEVAE